MAAAVAAPSPAVPPTPVSAVPGAAAASVSSVPSSSPSPSPSPLAQSESVWQSLLQRAGRRKDLLPPSSLLLLGDSGAGKSSLLRCFSDRVVSESGGCDYLLQYGFVNVRNAANADREELLARLNVWSLDDPNAVQLVPLLLSTSHASSSSSSSLAPPSSSAAPAASAAPSSAAAAASSSLYASYDNAVIAVCIDFSEPSTVSAQLQRWLGAVAAIRELVFAQLSKDERAALLSKISMHVQSYYNADLGTAAQTTDSVTPDPITGIPPPSAAVSRWQKQPPGAVAACCLRSAHCATVAAVCCLLLQETGVSLNPHIPEVNYGIPVLIVGTKTDAFARQSVAASAFSSLTADDRFEFLVFLLRSAALPSASSLFLTSASSPASVEAVQSYAYHRLYRFPFTVAPQPLATADSFAVCVPSGYDTPDLIHASQTREGRWTPQLRSSDVFRSEKRRSGNAAEAVAAAAAATGSRAQAAKAEVRAMDDAAFIKSIKAQLESSGGGALPSVTMAALPASASSSVAAAASSKSRPGVGALSSSSSLTSSPSGSQPTSPNSRKRLSANPKGGQVAVKAFFKSLLQQPAGGAATAGAAVPGAEAGQAGGSGSVSKRSSMKVRSDAEQELKRMSEAAQAKKDKERGEQKE